MNTVLVDLNKVLCVLASSIPCPLLSQCEAFRNQKLPKCIRHTVLASSHYSGSPSQTLYSLSTEVQQVLDASAQMDSQMDLSQDLSQGLLQGRSHYIIAALCYMLMKASTDWKCHRPSYFPNNQVRPLEFGALSSVPSSIAGT